jgi:hypothetical protein
LCGKQSAHAEDIADIEQAQQFIALPKLIDAEVELDSPAFVLDIGKRHLAHPTEGHDAPGNGDIGILLGALVGVALANLRYAVRAIVGVRVGLDPRLTQEGELFESAALLVVERFRLHWLCGHRASSKNIKSALHRAGKRGATAFAIFAVRDMVKLWQNCNGKAG